MRGSHKAAAGVLAAVSMALLGQGCATGCQDCPLYDRPALAFDGRRYLLVSIAEARVEGVVLTPDLVAESESSFPSARLASFDIAAVHGRDRFLLSWLFSEGVALAFLDPGPAAPPGALDFVDTTPLSLETPPVTASIGFDGRNFLVSWIGSRDPEGPDSPIKVARVSPAGDVLDPGGITVQEGVVDIRSAQRANRTPVTASSGRESLVVWAQRALGGGRAARVLAARLSLEGSILDPGGFLVADGRDEPAVTWDGRDYFVVCLRGRSADAGVGPEGPGPVSLQGRRVSPTGEVSEELFSIPARFPTLSLRVAAHGDVLLVVWNEGRRVRAARVHRDGSLLPPGAFDVGPGLPSGAALQPGPAGFVVAWTETYDPNPDTAAFDYSRVFVRAVGLDGTLGDPVRVRP